jgi:hypothetical protein
MIMALYHTSRGIISLLKLQNHPSPNLSLAAP